MIISCILIVCNFGSGVEYYSNGPATTYGGHFYQEGILTGIDGFNLSFSFEGGFQSNGFKLNFVDEFFDIRNRNESDLHNAVISCYYYDGQAGTATKITDNYVNRIGLSKGIAFLECNTYGLSLTKDYLFTIDSSEFPSAPDISIGQIINFHTGDGHDGTGYDIGLAYRVNATAANNFIYAKIPTLGDAANTWLVQPYRVFDAGVNVTGSCTFHTDTITIENIEYKRGFIEYNVPATNELTLCFYLEYTDEENFNYMMERMVKNLPGITLNSTNLIALKTFLQKRLFWVQRKSTTPPNNIYEYLYTGCTYTKQITGIKLLQDFYDTTLCNNLIRDNELYFKWIDYSNIETDSVGTFDDNHLDVSKYETDPDWVVNRYRTFYQHDGQGEFLLKKTFSFYDSIANRAVNGIKQQDLKIIFSGHNDFRDGKFHARTATKHNLILHQEALKKVYCTGNTDDTGILYPGDIIKFKHPDLLTPDEYRYYQVEKADYSNNEGINQIDLQLIDIEYLHDLDTDCKLNIHTWFAKTATSSGDLILWNDAPDSDSCIYPINGLVIETVASSLGGAMIKCNGSSHYFKIDDTTLTLGASHHDDSKYQAAKWDILQYTDYTIFFELKLNDYTPASYYWLINSYIDTNNEIRVLFDTNSALSFSIKFGGVQIMIAVSANNIIADTNIHQVAVVKSGNIFGIYLDGVQVAYTTYSGTESILGILYFMKRGNDTYYLDGYMSEIYMSASNIFDAAPNVGLTDTIAVKTNPFSWSGLNE